MTKQKLNNEAQIETSSVAVEVETSSVAVEAPKVKLDLEPVTISISAVTETNLYLISRATATERWFQKSKLQHYKRTGADTYDITVTRRELKYRDLLPKA